MIRMDLSRLIATLWLVCGLTVQNRRTPLAVVICVTPAEPDVRFLFSASGY